MATPQLTSEDAKKVRIWIFTFLGTFVVLAVMVVVLGKDAPPPPVPTTFAGAMVDARTSAGGANRLGNWLAGHKVGWSELAAQDCVTGEVVSIALDGAVLHAGSIRTADGEVAVIATGDLAGITPGASARLCGALVGDTVVGELDTPTNDPPAEKP